MANSTGVCTPDSGGLGYSCSCTAGYTWNSTSGRCQGAGIDRHCLQLDCSAVSACTHCVFERKLVTTGTADNHSCCVSVLAGPSNPCASSPCAAVANSTGVCTPVSAGLGYSCGCATGFTWNATSGRCQGEPKSTCMSCLKPNQPPWVVCTTGGLSC